jgi:hypothetical protein
VAYHAAQSSRVQSTGRKVNGCMRDSALQVCIRSLWGFRGVATMQNVEQARPEARMEYSTNHSMSRIHFEAQLVVRSLLPSSLRPSSTSSKIVFLRPTSTSTCTCTSTSTSLPLPPRPRNSCTPSRQPTDVVSCCDGSLPYLACRRLKFRHSGTRLCLAMCPFPFPFPFPFLNTRARIFCNEV